ncbi:MAG: UbiA family prenyltransferase [Polyangiaceae bacterium]|nr:UbiA family prenyltransferase [Polyangiaceae bacterium]
MSVRRASRLGQGVEDALAIARYHIVLVAMAASVVFGFVLTGRRPWLVALFVGLDWFLVNVVNRVTDIAEDLRNAIPGTAAVARKKALIVWGSVVLFAGSLAASHLLWPTLTPYRLAVQLVGLAYNFRVLPARRGRTRFKELYFLKNFMSAVLFVLTCFAYPLAADGGSLAGKLAPLAVLVLFFVPFELSYEVLYDLRDLEGDRAEGIPTFPVVHGPVVARRIVDALLALSAVALAAGFLARAVGVRELLMLCAPAAQFVFYRSRRRGLTTRDCILVTHLGTAELLLFVAGTALWERAGLPANVFLGGG